MAYEDKHGITDIRNGRRDALSISRDTDLDENDNEVPTAVFLYTPDMEDTNVHYHIELSVARAAQLADWLNKFVAEHK